MEFNSLTRRVAEFSGTDAAEIEPEAAFAGARSGAPAAREAGGEPTRETRGQATPELPLGRPSQPAELRRSKGEAPAYPELTPQILAAARAEAARNAKFDRGKYETIRDVPRLAAWVARARELGVVAIDVSAAG